MLMKPLKKVHQIRQKVLRRLTPVKDRTVNRTEFIIATAIILFVAFCLGWFANWLVHRFTRVSQADVNELEKMSQELHEAEETRDQAITYLQQREAELTNQLTQTEAELSAAMEGLREARHEAEELRSYVERMQNH
jgi:septal ring factor EnvC (AmiA/AmiB activator)